MGHYNKEEKVERGNVESEMFQGVIFSGITEEQREGSKVSV